MSNLRDLLSKANRKHEMRWKVLVFDPKKDNELVDEFKDFECIDCATAKKRELLEKHPDKTIEIIAESIKRKTEAKLVQCIVKLKKNSFGATAIHYVPIKIVKDNTNFKPDFDIDKIYKSTPEFSYALAYHEPGDTKLANLKNVWGGKYDWDYPKNESINRKTEAGKEIKVGNQRFYTTNDNGIIFVRKIAPYDDADYYYAVYDPQKVRLVFTQSGGKNKQASMVKYNDTAKQIEEIAKKLIELNKHIQPKMVHESSQKNEDRQEHFRFRLQTKDEREKVKNLDRLSNIKEKQGYYYVTFLAKTNSAGELAEYLRQNKIYPVDLLGVTDYTKESVTKANYKEIIKALSDTIAKAAKKYPEAKLVKNYQATRGSTGAFLDEGLHFTGKDAVFKAIAVSDELKKVMSKYGFKDDIGGILPYMIGNNYHSTIITFGSVSQGSNGASVGYYYMKDALKFLESAQINETRGYKVIVELGVPDNMNNRDIEDEVERLLRTSRKIDVVIDVTAERH